MEIIVAVNDERERSEEYGAGRRSRSVSVEPAFCDEGEEADG